MQQQSSSEDHSKHLIGREILLRPSAQLDLKALLHSVSQLLHQFWLEVGKRFVLISSIISLYEENQPQQVGTMLSHFSDLGMRSPNSVRIVSVVAPHSGVAVFLEGLLGRLCDWDLLQKSSGEEKPVRQHMAEAFALDQYRLAKILAVVVPMCFLSQSINHLGRNRVIGFK